MKLLIFVSNITNRVRYAFDLLLHEQLGIDFALTSNALAFDNSNDAKLCYGENPFDDVPSQRAVPLLFERDIFDQDVKTVDFMDVKGLFPVYSAESIMPFDVFAASFYLVSRYEEYLPQVRDAHGRYKAEDGIMFRIGMLNKPLVNIWAQELGHRLQQCFPEIQLKKKNFTFIPTYDIDAAWAYKHKGLMRMFGSLLRDFGHADWNEMRQHLAVVFNRLPDPFYTFDLQIQLQKKFKVKPIYFILCGEYGANDKNIPLHNEKFQVLIKMLSDYAEVGVHPSYDSYLKKNKIQSEIDGLSRVLNEPLTKSRQHFLRMNLPRSYKMLEDLSITDDYTMGFASQVGFRAGIADTFRFFDLELNAPSRLMVHPFAVMDGTLNDYLHLKPEEAQNVVLQLLNEVKKINGTFILLWHNESLSNQKRWQGWLEVYEKILEQATCND